MSTIHLIGCLQLLLFEKFDNNMERNYKFTKFSESKPMLEASDSRPLSALASASVSALAVGVSGQCYVYVLMEQVRVLRVPSCLSFH